MSECVKPKLGKLCAGIAVAVVAAIILIPSALGDGPDPMDPANWTHDMKVAIKHGPYCKTNTNRPICWKPFAGVRLSIYSAGGTFLYTKVTNATGHQFLHFPKGHYTMKVSAPVGQPHSLKTESFAVASPFPLQLTATAFNLTVCIVQSRTCSQ